MIKPPYGHEIRYYLYPNHVPYTLNLNGFPDGRPWVFPEPAIDFARKCLMAHLFPGPDVEFINLDCTVYLRDYFIRASQRVKRMDVSEDVQQFCEVIYGRAHLRLFPQGWQLISEEFDP
jgi:hypothetical protein